MNKENRDTRVIGPITLPVPTEEQPNYFNEILGADMPNEQVKQCTCTIGGPKPLKPITCPIHDR